MTWASKLSKNFAGSVRVYRVSNIIPAEHAPAPNQVVVAEKPAIAVLPFTNMSGDPEQDYFSDGVTEDIITELSRFRQLSVIARNSSFVYRGKAFDIKRVGRELGVDYVLEGSVRSAGNKVRVTAQLVDTRTGSHIWAERYDREIGDIFAVQDEIIQTLVSTLSVQLEVETLSRAKRKPPGSLRAYDLWLKGKRCLDLWTPHGNLEARKLFQEAIEVDPEYARAYAGLAATYEWTLWYSAWDSGGKDTRDGATRFAQKAVMLDDTDAHPHVILAWVHQLHRKFDLARRHLDRALALNPNDADCLANCGMILNSQGSPEEGGKWIEAAMRLNPHHPDWYLCFLGASYFLRGEYEKMIDLMERAPEGLPEVRALLAAAYAHVDRPAEAGRHLGEFLRTYSQHWSGAPSAGSVTAVFSFKRSEDAERLKAGLRKAGLPE
jgi:TolB-like protein/Tfp pilus assembly protein PilF